MFTFINRFTVTGDPAEFEAVLGEISAYMKRQSGFRSHRLYRSLQNAAVYVETADWDDPAAHRRATQTEEFPSMIQRLMKLATADPGGFELLDHEG